MSVKGHFWVYESGLRSLYDHSGIIVESLWVFKVDFQKTFIFPIDFNDFIKLGG